MLVVAEWCQDLSIKNDGQVLSLPVLPEIGLNYIILNKLK